MMRKRLHYFSTFELMLLTELAAMSVVLKIVLRLPMRLPGKSGIFEIALVLLARSLVPRLGAGTYMQTLTALLRTALGSGEGILYYTLPRTVIRGVIVDLALCVPWGRARVVGYALAGALAGAGKAAIGYFMLSLLGPPEGVLMTLLGYGLVTHTIFGAVGGVLAERLLAALERAGLDAYLAERR